ncbi:nucleotide-diphospho-sugar transferase [Tribonema minus]|uniref:Nucleotide-diphospho-sugar transferase n=1 Tax=Tribonema minus TaxID=303371 RepID=A0A836CCW4_9STRA|nr:nucleotide-diphospho-sugar transferase [Tribonema minus]
MRDLARQLYLASGTAEEGLALLADELTKGPGAAVLPVPPDDEEMLSYLDAGRALVVSAGVAAVLPLSVGLWLYTAVEVWFAPVALLTTGYLLVSYFGVGLWGRRFDAHAHAEALARASEAPSGPPSVDVFLPCCGEPADVLANAYEHVAALRWGGPLAVHVLDDGARASAAVEAMARRHGFRYVRRGDPGRMKKAGNLRSAFARTHGEFIAILDADFCPRPDFLQQTVPLMVDDAGIAIVQSPQWFRVSPSMNWVERAAGSVQELFHRLVQQNRDRFDAAICVGSCGVYRRAALAPMGGTAEKGASEDVWTGVLTTCDGWRVRYLPLILATGLCPDSRRAYFKQNYRWCLGSIALTTSREFWTSPLTATQKMCYLTGAGYYASTALSLVANAAPAISLVLLRPDMVRYYNSLWAVPSVLFPWVIMRIWARHPYGVECLRIRYLQYSAHLFAIWDHCFGTATAWVPTGAAGAGTQGRRDSQFRRAMSFLLLTTVAQLLALYAGCAYRIAEGYAWYDFAPSVAIETLSAFLCAQSFFA